MGDLSENFSLAEFTASQTAARSGRIILPTDEELEALTALVTDTMQVIRDRLGVPIRITSGLRPEWLNSLIGGSSKSQHIKGQACDFVVPGLPPFEVALAVSADDDIPYDQLILEFDEWVHISLVEKEACRREDLTARHTNEGTNYSFGIAD